MDLGSQGALVPLGFSYKKSFETQEVVVLRTNLSGFTLAMTLSVASAVQGAQADTDALIENIITLHDVREQYLLRSEGRCSVEMEYKTFSAKNRLAGMVDNEDDAANKARHGRCTAQFLWRSRDSRIRFDIYVPPENEDRGMFLAQSMRVVYDKEQCIYYDVLDERAYMNNPPLEAVGLTYLEQRFDIRKFYNIDDRDVPQNFKLVRDSEMVPEIQDVVIDGLECKRFEYKFKVREQGALVRERDFSMTFAPKLAYSMVSGQFHVRVAVDGNLVNTRAVTYDAKYSEDPDHPGVWYVKRLDATDERLLGEEIRQERIGVDVHEIRLGVEIDEAHFTFEGMDVPLGTLVYDKRVIGDPVELQLREDGLHPISKDDPSYPMRETFYEREARTQKPPQFVVDNIEDLDRAVAMEGEVQPLHAAEETTGQLTSETALERLNPASPGTALGDDTSNSLAHQKVLLGISVILLIGVTIYIINLQRKRS